MTILTPEALIQFGFKPTIQNQGEMTVYRLEENPLTHKSTIELKWMKGNEAPYYGPKRILYEDQVQTLYHFLTGKHLIKTTILEGRNEAQTAFNR